LGFYDKSCAISGLSLKGENAAGFLLVEDGGGWRPASTLLHGKYNRLGVVDAIVAPPKVETYFGEHDEDDRQPFLDAVARGEVRHEGDRVDVVLFHWRMFDAAVIEMRRDPDVKTYSVHTGVADDEVHRSLFREALFEGRGPGARMLSRVSESICKTAAFFAWMTRHGTWAPNPPDGQHHEEEIRERFATARETVAANPVLLEWVELAIADTEKRWAREAAQS